MSKIGVFYGSTTGTTEDVARKIAEKLNVPQGDIHDASTLTDALVKEYDVLVLMVQAGITVEDVTREV